MPSVIASRTINEVEMTHQRYESQIMNRTNTLNWRRKGRKEEKLLKYIQEPVITPLFKSTVNKKQ